VRLAQKVGLASVLWCLSMGSSAQAQGDIQENVLGNIQADALPQVSVDANYASSIGAPFDVTVEASLPIVALPGDDYFAPERRGRKQLIELFSEPAFSDANLDYSWAIIEPGELVIERLVSPSEDGSSHLVGRALWKIASLEAGERSLPPILWTGFELAVPEPLIIQGVLDESEQSPRPLAGFREPPPERSPEREFPFGYLWIGAGIGVALLGVMFLRRGSSEARLTPRERQARVAQQFVEMADLVATGKQPTAAQLRSAHFTLTASLRESVELKRELGGDVTDSRQQAALTDHEWAHALGAPAEVHDFFAAIGMVKYAGDVPTAWGFAERLGMVTELQESLAECVPPTLSSTAVRSGEGS
jgi:hypothetical protein